MKKILLLSSIAFILTAGSLFAQKQLYFGAGGTGMSTWLINQYNYGLTPSWDEKIAFSYGVNANVGFDFNKNLGVKLELGYSRLGQNYEKKRNDTLFSRNLALSYFQLPVLFKFRTGGEVAKFMFALGPQFEFLTGAKQRVYANDIETDEYYGDYVVPGTTVKINEWDVKQLYNSFDVMARLDLGVEIVIIDNLFIDAALSFAYGLTDIIKTEYSSQLTNYDPMHNTYVGLNVGVNYVLPLK
jgi:opacity protein-like surface antigen